MPFRLSGQERALVLAWRAFVAYGNERDAAHRYAASGLHDLSEAEREISTFRDAVVTYGDRVRMSMAASPAMQQAIDRSFDRDN